MSTYKNIFGKSVKFLATDPDNAEAEGQIWYNSTDGAFKDVIVNEAWSSSSPLNNANQNNSGDGTQNAALSVGGTFPANMADFEEYNGSGWTSQSNVPYDAQIAATCGTQTAAITFGGTNPTNPREATTIEYDGSTWTAGGSLNTARLGMFGAGTQTATLAAQGGSAPSAATNITEEYNGSAWTTVNSTVTTKRNSPAGFGVQTAAVGAIGGGDPSENPTNTSEEYDGTNWTASATINTSRLNLSGTGTNTAGLIHGGATGVGGGTNTGATEKWDGTSWTTTSSMATARNQKGQRAGSSSAALAFGGYDGTSPSSVTEEFTKSINVITPAAWSSGGTIPDSKRDGFVGSIGTQTAGLAFGGEPVNAETYEYNGSTWAVGGDLGTGRRVAAGFGTQTAAGAAGGNTSVGFSAFAGYETYDGTSWTEQNDLNTARASAAGAGTQTAAVIFGGGTPTFSSAVEEYSGSSWTSVTSLPAVRSFHAGAGTQTAALATGGQASGSPPYGIYNSSVEYNGSAWTAGGNLITARTLLGGAGTQTAFIAIGGDTNYNPHNTQTLCEQYNGTSFSTMPSLAVVGQNFRGTGGTTSAAYEAGGFGPGGANVDTTEEFTGETLALNVKTITTS